jgi:hypothetical protein
MKKIEWCPVYSDTEEDDDMGRWGRKALVKTNSEDIMPYLTVGYINKVKGKDGGLACYYWEANVPSNNSINPHNGGTAKTHEEAKYFVIKAWRQFNNLIEDEKHKQGDERVELIEFLTWLGNNTPSYSVNKPSELVDAYLKSKK